MSKLYEPLSEEEKEKGFLGKAWDTAKTVAGAAALVGGGYALGNPALRGKIGAALKGAVKGGKLGDMAGHTGDTAITAFNKGAAATARTPLPVGDPYHIPGLKGLDARMAGKPIAPTPAAAASDAIKAAQKSGTAQTISTVNKSLKRAIPGPLTPLTDPNIRAAAGKVGDSISGAYDRVRDQLKAAKAAAATPATTTGAAATPAPATNLNPSAGSGSLSMGRTAFNTKPTTPAPANTTGATTTTKPRLGVDGYGSGGPGATIGAPAGGAATQQGSRVRGTTNVRTRPTSPTGKPYDPKTDELLRGTEGGPPARTPDGKFSDRRVGGQGKTPPPRTTPGVTVPGGANSLVPKNSPYGPARRPPAQRGPGSFNKDREQWRKSIPPMNLDPKKGPVG
jgi:hypothetical protein